MPESRSSVHWYRWLALGWNVVLLGYIFGAHVVSASTGEGRILGIIVAAVLIAVSNVALVMVRWRIQRRTRR